MIWPICYILPFKYAPYKREGVVIISWCWFWMLYFRKSMCTSWIYLRPRRYGSLQRPSKKDTKPLMYWWVICLPSVNTGIINAGMNWHFMNCISLWHCRSIMQVVWWPREKWMQRALRKVLPVTPLVSEVWHMVEVKFTYVNNLTLETRTTPSLPSLMRATCEGRQLWEVNNAEGLHL